MPTPHAALDAAWLEGHELAVAATADDHAHAMAHLTHPGRQEDLTFAYWRPGVGAVRLTAIVNDLVLPGPGDRTLHGNVAFTPQYVRRVLANVPPGSGVALLHSHLTPGWQGMSRDDVTAEQLRLASAAAGTTGLPLLGVTTGTDGFWSARFWGRVGRHDYERFEVNRVRVVGATGARLWFHPSLQPAPPHQASQVATLSVWGSEAQADVARSRVAVVGVGSVGSLAVESLARVGFSDVVLIDPDTVEVRNLDRLVHASPGDVGRPKVDLAAAAAALSHTSAAWTVSTLQDDLRTAPAMALLRDCDAVLSCVDRPAPRWDLNRLAYSHLIPIIDGGIHARVDEHGRPLHVDWRIHTIGPGRACLICLGALLRSDVGLDLAGLLDDPGYIAGLSPADRARYERRNVFPFAMAVAAHQVLHLVGALTSTPRVSGIGPQHYSAYPGTMTAEPTIACKSDCEFRDLLAAGDLDGKSTP